MSLKSTLLVATALVSYFGLATAQTVPANLKLSAKSADSDTDRTEAVFRREPIPGKSAGHNRPEAGLKLARPQQLGSRPAGASQQKTIDESALRYYASEADTARVAAEIRRLQTLYPNWQPPANLFTSGTTQVDEQRLWGLFALGQYEDLAEQIQALQAEFLDYSPSAELTMKLSIATRRQSLVAASKQRDWEQVVALATDNQDLLVCREIDVLWRLSEALGAMEEKEQALDVYRYILANCDNPKERLATVQKATLVLSDEEINRMIASGKKAKGGGNEFDPVRLDLIRRTIGTLAAGQPASAPSEREVKLIDASARSGRNHGDAGLLGWYAYSTKDYGKAREWFKLAYEVGKDPKHLEGYILSLRNLGEVDQAKTMAYQNRAAAPLIRKSYIEIAAVELGKPTAELVSAEEIERLEELIDTEQSALGAQSLGWHLFRQNKFAQAKTWFEKSSLWGESEESALGLALSMQRLGDRKSYSAFLANKKSKFQSLDKLAIADNIRLTSGGRRSSRGGGPSGLIKESLALFESGNYKQAAALMDKNQQKLDPGMNALRGWAHFKANNFHESEAIFKKYGHVKGSSEGEFLSYIAGRSHASKWYQ